MFYFDNSIQLFIFLFIFFFILWVIAAVDNNSSGEKASAFAMCFCVVALITLPIIYMFGDKEVITDKTALASVNGVYITYTGERSTIPTVYVETEDGTFDTKKLEGATIKKTEEDAYLLHEINLSSFGFIRLGDEKYTIYVPE